MTERLLTIDYTNYRGERALRRVEPLQWRFGTSEPYHNEPQWLLHARDVEREGDVRRDFALSGIHGFGERAITLTAKVDAPPPGSEERDFWLEAAEHHGLLLPTDEGESWVASEDAVLKLMAAAREQGRKDILDKL